MLLSGTSVCSFFDVLVCSSLNYLSLQLFRLFRISTSIFRIPLLLHRKLDYAWKVCSWGTDLCSPFARFPNSVNITLHVVCATDHLEHRCEQKLSLELHPGDDYCYILLLYMPGFIESILYSQLLKENKWSVAVSMGLLCWNVNCYTPLDDRLVRSEQFSNMPDHDVSWKASSFFFTRLCCVWVAFSAKRGVWTAVSHRRSVYLMFRQSFFSLLFLSTSLYWNLLNICDQFISFYWHLQIFRRVVHDTRQVTV